jgi:diadenylate cyclase
VVEEVVSVLQELRENFRVVDAFDIAVIAVLLYGVLLWFRQSASRSVVVGVSAMMLLYFAARTFDMYLTSLVFQTAFTVILVVMVVLFQEDIRRVFERVAGWGGFGRMRPGTTARLREFNTLVEAAFALAARKTGALIALVGREPMRRHVTGGVGLSGRITEPILFSIFDPSSPGHDGAVIIERDRIERFGAHLPISKNHKELHGRGTRHAAALGLSECSDALVVVVSEERGLVSVAEHGVLREVLSAAELIARLDRFHEDRFPRKLETTWKRLAARHVPLKLLAVLLAVAAWFVLAFNVERIQTTVLVPIEYRNIPKQARVDPLAPVEAYVTLSGSELSFRLLDTRVLKISIDLTGVTDAKTIPISPDSLTLPSNVRVDRIEPEEIEVHLVPVQPPPPPPEGTSPPRN